MKPAIKKNELAKVEAEPFLETRKIVLQNATPVPKYDFCTVQSLFFFLLLFNIKKVTDGYISKKKRKDSKLQTRKKK